MSEARAHDEVGELWAEYKATGDPGLRNRLVLQYSPLVKYVAGRVGVGLPHHVDHADLVSDGIIGLMDAIEKFDPGRGLQFQTYAVPRIRGAIIDALRASDWVPRAVRDKVRNVEKAQAALEARLGRPPTDREIAEALDMSVQELRDVLGRASHANLVSLDELGSPEELSEAAGGDPLEDDDLRATLVHAVKDLPERDRIIVALYYFEGLTLAEIGQVLGVTESRVSQLHTRVTLALRTRLLSSSAA